MPLVLTALAPDGEAAESLWSSIENITASNIFGAVLSVVISLILIKVLTKVVNRALGRSKLDASLQTLLRNLVKGALWAVAAIIVLGCLGIEVTSLVAVLSVVGLAFSLALQNFLSNVAGGIQLLASHPFAVGDFVDVGVCAGTVEEIGMFYTKVTTPDNKLVQLPNSAIVTANITNFSAQPTRRVELNVSASYDAPTGQVAALLVKLAGEHPLVLADPEPAVHVEQYGDSAICYVMRVWCANDDYWTVYYDLLDGFKPAFDQAGVEMTYPHVNVHMVGR